MEAWRTVWRKGIAPQLSTPGLVALRAALLDCDPRLLQGATTSPPPLACVQNWAVEGACAVGFAGWRGDGLQTVAGVEEFFARVCRACDGALGEPQACRYFLNWHDETPRGAMCAALLAEVERTLTERGDGPHAASPGDDP